MGDGNSGARVFGDAIGKNRNAEQLTAKVLFAPLAGESAAHGKRGPAQDGRSKRAREAPL